MSGQELWVEGSVLRSGGRALHDLQGHLEVLPGPAAGRVGTDPESLRVERALQAAHARSEAVARVTVQMMGRLVSGITTLAQETEQADRRAVAGSGAVQRTRPGAP